MTPAIRCGLIGYGRIGRMTAEILRSGATRLELAGIADQPSAFGTDPAIVFRDYRQLLETDVQAVIIATPPALHYEIAVQALRAGKDVWIEKPPARTSAEARGLVRIALASGCVLFFAYHARYNPAVVAARLWLAGAEVHSIEAQYKERAESFHAPGSWVYEEGVLRDSGINVFSALLELLPHGTDPRVLSAWSNGTPGRHPTQARMQLTGDVTIDMDWEYTASEVRKLRIQSSRGVCSTDLSRGLFMVNGAPYGDSAIPNDSMKAEYEGMLRDWEKRLRTRESFARVQEIELLGQIESYLSNR